MIYRGIYHAHSKYSGDGHYTLPELRQICLDLGLSFIVMTEHAEDMTPESLGAYIADCAACSDEKFLFVPGLEVPYIGKVHVGCFPVVPAPEVPMYAGGIKGLHDSGSTTVIHHPSKQGYYIDETLPTLIDYVEVWNTRYEGRVAPSERTLAFAHTHYQEKPVIGGFDLHTPKQLGGAYIDLEASALTVVEVCRAWRAEEVRTTGRYFSFGAKEGIRGMLRVYHRILRVIYRASCVLRDLVR